MNQGKGPLTVEFTLLAFLQQGPQHGYEIYRLLQACRREGLVWHVKQSMVYAMLARLEDEGFVSGQLEAAGGRPPRKLLHLTPAGDEAYRRWLCTPVRFGRDFRLEFLAKLYFAKRAGPATAMALVDAQRTVSHTQYDQMESGARNAPDDDSYAALVADFRAGQMKAILEWLDRCSMRLAQQTPAPQEKAA